MNTRLLFLPIILISILNYSFAQELRIQRGVVVDSLKTAADSSETFSLYLPKNFENKGTWPLFVVVDEKGRGKQTLSTFVEASEGQDYILASSNAVHDSLSLTENVQRFGRLFASLSALFPLNRNRLFVGGYDAGGRLANVLPVFFKNLKGVVSVGATINNLELVDSKNPFHFIGIVGREDFTYNEVLSTEEFFNKLKFDNNILVFNGGKVWPKQAQLSKSLHYLTLRSMAREYVGKDTVYIQKIYKNSLNDVEILKKNKEMLLAYRELKEMQNAFRDLMDIDSVKNAMRDLKKDKLYRLQKRRQDETFFKESFLKEDYQFALEDDIRTYNYNNLGWWNYQMSKLNEFVTGENIEERRMGKRLIGYVNALVEDSIDFYRSQDEGKKDDEAELFLSMLKTITEPYDFEFYMDVISLSAKYEDYGTSIFYLEEALKKGFVDRKKLYDLPDTALLRITPEFNKLVEKYLESPRYEIKER